MSERPTPEDIARTGSPEFVNPRLDLLATLRGYGYRIVHPDDVPRRKVWPDELSPWEPNGDDQARGWNACRAHIFREGT